MAEELPIVRRLLTSRRTIDRIEGIELIKELVEAARDVLALSDRKHEAWDRLRATIARAEEEQG